MKRVFINALVLLIAFAIYACEKSSHKNSVGEDESREEFENISLQNSNDLYESTFLDSLKKPIHPDSGGFIKSDKANEMLELYKKHRGSKNPNYSAEKDIYGFTFGINKMEELIQNIRQYKGTNPKDTLVGIRVYFGRKIVDGDTIPDVFFIGVKPNGKNVYPIDNGFDKTKDFSKEEDVILNISIPCPNRCD